MEAFEFTTNQPQFSIPCVMGRFGDRLVSYTTTLPATAIRTLLGHDPRSKNWNKLPEPLGAIYKYLQRPTSKDRREGVSQYIIDRLGPNAHTIGAFPSISIALMGHNRFVPVDPSTGLPKSVGALHIDLSDDAHRVLIDGLGRVTGALDLIEDGEKDAVGMFSFPVTIYTPMPGTSELTWEDVGQLFHDFNFRVTPVTAQHAIALDTSDLYIALANKLADEPFIANNGGLARRQASLGAKSTELVVQAVLVRAVRGAMEGRAFQEANLSAVSNPNLTGQTLTVAKQSLAEFFGSFAEEMGERFKQRRSIHLTAPGWQALGVIYNDIVYRKKMAPAEREFVIKKLAAIDWSRTNSEWFGIGLGEAEVDKKTGQKVLEDGKPVIALTGAGRTNVQKLIDFLRAKAGYALSDDPENLI